MLKCLRLVTGGRLDTPIRQPMEFTAYTLCTSSQEGRADALVYVRSGAATEDPVLINCHLSALTARNNCGVSILLLTPTPSPFFVY